eukprot:CAMPEP_0175168466 /NCGR_PEP_ID=MMETSP0087-20121206/28970_1 /TAXON_ID=136419 /ORGANISM="Unknown Unknown, Strain D1" /LENGTH=51 /DNA_ID=CAMNT_0016458583 /DNA_START=91 /DNA_END=243 /DNA_ORIENTATION=-
MRWLEMEGPDGVEVGRLAPVLHKHALAKTLPPPPSSPPASLPAAAAAAVFS